MGTLKTSTTILVLLALNSLVLTPAPAAADESPWYIGATVGRANADALFGSRHLKRIDDESEAAAVALGYTVNRHLAIQAGFHDLGIHRGIGSPCPETDETCIEALVSLDLCIEGSNCALVEVPLDASLSAFSLALVPRWPVSERFSLHGKIGLMAWDSEVSAPSELQRVANFSGDDLLLGLGLRYEFANGFGVQLEREALDLDVSSTLLGVSWRF